MSESKNKRAWVVPALLGATAAAGVCVIFAVAGWFFFIRNNLVAIETPEPIAQFLIPSASPTQATATLLPTVALTPVLTATTAAPSATRSAPVAAPTQPRPTATLGPITGKIAFSVDRGDRPEDKSVWIMNVDGSGAKKILDWASAPAFSPDGTKIAYYHWNDGIYVAGTDGSNPQKIVGETNAKQVAWSHDGRWIAFRSWPNSSGNEYVDAVLTDGTGRRRISIGSTPAWSLDDHVLALTACRGTACGVHRVSSDTGDPVPLTTDAGGNPAWSPDGKKILYSVESNQVKQLFVMNADGSDKKQLTSGASMHVSGQWSSDGNYIFYRTPESGSWAIWRINADGTHPIKLIEDTPPSIDWPYEKLAVLTSTK